MTWPRDALYEVSKKFINEKLDFKPKIKESISQVFCNIHMDVMEATTRMYNELKRNYYITPTHYLELVLGYIRVLKNKQ